HWVAPCYQAAACHVDIAAAINCKARGKVIAAPADKSIPDQRPTRAQLGDEGVTVGSVRMHRATPSAVTLTGNVDFPARINCNPMRIIIAAAPEKRIPDEHPCRGQLGHESLIIVRVGEDGATPRCRAESRHVQVAAAIDRNMAPFIGTAVTEESIP